MDTAEGLLRELEALYEKVRMPMSLRADSQQAWKERDEFHDVLHRVWPLLRQALSSSQESAVGREKGREQSHAVSVPTGSADTVPAPPAPTMLKEPKVTVMLETSRDWLEQTGDLSGPERMMMAHAIRAGISLLAQREERIRELENSFENLGAVLREKPFQLDQIKELIRNIEHWFLVLSEFAIRAEAKKP